MTTLKKETLIALGIDIDDLKEQIVSLAAKTLLAEISAETRTEIVKTVHKSVEVAIGAEVNRQVENALNFEYQPVDHWGEPQGKKTTLREKLKDSVLEWWSAKVDENGKADTGWGAKKTRAEWFAKKAVDEVMQNELKADFSKIFGAAKEELKKGIAERIAEIAGRL